MIYFGYPFGFRVSAGLVLVMNFHPNRFRVRVRVSISSFGFGCTETRPDPNPTRCHPYWLGLAGGRSQVWSQSAAVQCHVPDPTSACVVRRHVREFIGRRKLELHTACRLGLLPPTAYNCMRGLFFLFFSFSKRDFVTCKFVMQIFLSCLDLA